MFVSWQHPTMSIMAHFVCLWFIVDEVNVLFEYFGLVFWANIQAKTDGKRLREKDNG